MSITWLLCGISNIKYLADMAVGQSDQYFFEFYNTERPHQSLGDLTPIQVYQTGSGGGAKIVDKFKERKSFVVVKAKSKAETTTLNSTDYCLD